MEKNDLISRSDVLELMEVDFRYEQCNQVSDYVENIPAVDAVPVVHGAWKPIHFEGGILSGENADRCSACGYDRLLGDEHGVRYKTTYNFCPYCGARMDGKDDDNENR